MEKNPQNKARTNDKLDPLMMLGPGFEPRPLSKHRTSPAAQNWPNTIGRNYFSPSNYFQPFPERIETGTARNSTSHREKTKTEKGAEGS